MEKLSALWFQVAVDSRTRVYSAVNAAGETLIDARKRPVSDFDFSCTLVRKPWKADDILNSTGCEFVISTRLFAIIERECRVPDFVQKRGTRILDSDGAKLADYKILDHQLNNFDILARERSELDVKNGIIVAVKKLVADRSKIPNFDLFPIMPIGWIASVDAVTVFRQVLVSGAKFYPVETI